jgi:HK97 family phage major capsid protein
MDNLISKRAELVAKARAFLDTHTAKDGTMSAEDSHVYDKIEAELSAIEKSIERENKLKATENRLSEPTTAPILTNPSAKVKTTATDEYKKAFLDTLRSGFKRVSNVLVEGTDSAGGYLVPDEYDRRLIDGLADENIVRKLGTVIRTAGEHKINIVASKPQAAWVDEGAAITFGTETLSQVVLDAYKLVVAVQCSNELLYDNAFNLESHILSLFVAALANAEEDAFLNGNGTGKPTGIFAATGGGQIGITTASATAITADEVINLVYALKRPYRKNGAFILNDNTIAGIRKLKDGSGAYIWQPSFIAGEPDRLLGYPVHTSAYAPLVAAGASVVAFGDYKYYNIGDRGTRSFAELKELFAANDLTGFIAKERVDGKLVLPEAIQLLAMKTA